MSEFTMKKSISLIFLLFLPLVFLIADEMEQLEAAIATLHSEIGSLDAENSRLSDEILELTELIGRAEDLIHQIKINNLELNAIYRESTPDARARASEQLTENNRTIAALNDKIQIWQQHVVQLEQEIDVNSAKIEVKQELLLNHRRRINELTGRSLTQ